MHAYKSFNNIYLGGHGPPGILGVWVQPDAPEGGDEPFLNSNISSPPPALVTMSSGVGRHP